MELTSGARVRVDFLAPPLASTVQVGRVTEAGYPPLTGGTPNAGEATCPRVIGVRSQLFKRRLELFACTAHRCTRGCVRSRIEESPRDRPLLRALILALDRWAGDGATPPPSVYPTIPREVLAGQSQPGKGWEKSSPEEQAARLRAGEEGLAMQDWIDAVRDALGLDLAVDLDAILDVARDAAHNVERPAAPLTTYLLGAAVGRGADPIEAAATISALAAGWGNPSPDA